MYELVSCVLFAWSLQFFIFQVSNVLFIFANNSFSNIWSINSYSDGLISQNVILYLAYTEYKQNQV